MRNEGRKIVKGALTVLPIGLYQLMVRGASRRRLLPVTFTSRDHFPHRDVRAEWWYFTSVLTTPERKAPLGLEVTFFRVKTLVDSAIVHVAVSDVDYQKFSFTGMVLPVYLPFRSGPDTVIEFFGNHLAYDEDTGSFAIGARLKNFQVDISCAGQDLMAQGPGGIQDMENSPGDASYYFTQPNMATKGVIVLNNERLPVTGLTWHDHQWGNFHVANLKWDWFSLRFDAEGIYVMLFNFDRRGTVYRAGNICRHGRTMPIERFDVRAMDICTDAHGLVYPIDWEPAHLRQQRRRGTVHDRSREASAQGTGAVVAGDAGLLGRAYVQFGPRSRSQPRPMARTSWTRRPSKVSLTWS